MIYDSMIKLKGKMQVIYFTLPKSIW